MFKKNQQIQLSDGVNYLYIGTITVEGHNYHFLSPMDEDRYVMGELIEQDGKRSFAIVKDPKIAENVQKYYDEHPDCLQ
jgi:hypothetical protein